MLKHHAGKSEAMLKHHVGKSSVQTAASSEEDAEQTVKCCTGFKLHGFRVIPETRVCNHINEAVEDEEVEEEVRCCHVFKLHGFRVKTEKKVCNHVGKKEKNEKAEYKLEERTPANDASTLPSNWQSGSKIGPNQASRRPSENIQTNFDNIRRSTSPRKHVSTIEIVYPPSQFQSENAATGETRTSPNHWQSDPPPYSEIVTSHDWQSGPSAIIEIKAAPPGCQDDLSSSYATMTSSPSNQDGPPASYGAMTSRPSSQDDPSSSYGIMTSPPSSQDGPPASYGTLTSPPSWPSGHNTASETSTLPSNWRSGKVKLGVKSLSASNNHIRRLSLPNVLEPDSQASVHPSLVRCISPKMGTQKIVKRDSRRALSSVKKRLNNQLEDDSSSTRHNGALPRVLSVILGENETEPEGIALRNQPYSTSHIQEVLKTPPQKDTPMFSDEGTALKPNQVDEVDCIFGSSTKDQNPPDLAAIFGSCSLDPNREDKDKIFDSSNIDQNLRDDIDTFESSTLCADHAHDDIDGFNTPVIIPNHPDEVNDLATNFPNHLDGNVDESSNIDIDEGGKTSHSLKKRQVGSKVNILLDHSQVEVSISLEKSGSKVNISPDSCYSETNTNINISLEQAQTDTISPQDARTDEISPEQTQNEETYPEDAQNYETSSEQTSVIYLPEEWPDILSELAETSINSAAKSTGVIQSETSLQDSSLLPEGDHENGNSTQEHVAVSPEVMEDITTVNSQHISPCSNTPSESSTNSSNIASEILSQSNTASDTPIPSSNTISETPSVSSNTASEMSLHSSPECPAEADIDEQDNVFEWPPGQEAAEMLKSLEESVEPKILQQSEDLSKPYSQNHNAGVMKENAPAPKSQRDSGNASQSGSPRSLDEQLEVHQKEIHECFQQIISLTNRKEEIAKVEEVSPLEATEHIQNLNPLEMFKAFQENPLQVFKPNQSEVSTYNNKIKENIPPIIFNKGSNSERLVRKCLDPEKRHVKWVEEDKVSFVSMVSLSETANYANSNLNDSKNSSYDSFDLSNTVSSTPNGMDHQANGQVKRFVFESPAAVYQVNPKTITRDRKISENILGIPSKLGDQLGGEDVENEGSAKIPVQVMLSLPLTAKEMRDRLAGRKKEDPRVHKTNSFKQKCHILQSL